LEPQINAIHTDKKNPTRLNSSYIFDFRIAFEFIRVYLRLSAANYRFK